MRSATPRAVASRSLSRSARPYATVTRTTRAPGAVVKPAGASVTGTSELCSRRSAMPPSDTCPSSPELADPSTTELADSSATTSSSPEDTERARCSRVRTVRSGPATSPAAARASRAWTSCTARYSASAR